MPRISLAARHFPPPGRMVDVGGCKLHLRVSGSGGPAVVLESGIAATSLSWALVEPALAQFTTVVSYDRAGLGWSDPAVTPRTPGHIARELKCALDQVCPQPGYILAGHSFGGLAVRRFCADYPESTLGLVLVDPLNPTEWLDASGERRRMLARGASLSRRGAVLARLQVVRASLTFLLSGNRIVPKLAARLSSGAGGSSFTERIAGEVRKLPRELWPAVAFHWSQAKSFEGMARHLEYLPESAMEVARAGGGGDCAAPVTLLLAAHSPEPVTPAHWNVRRAAKSGHWIHLDEPELVVLAVREMIEQRRG